MLADLEFADPDALDALIEQASGRPPTLVTADVSRRSEVAAFVSSTVERFGRLDVLVTAAGHLEPVALWDMSDETLDRMIDVHLKGTVYCVQAAVQPMQANRYGRIVCIASVGRAQGGGLEQPLRRGEGGDRGLRAVGRP